MKAFSIMSVLLLALSQGCDRKEGKGSDREWQQRQEQMEQEKQQDPRELDEEQFIEEKTREVNASPESKET